MPEGKVSAMRPWMILVAVLMLHTVSAAADTPTHAVEAVSKIYSIDRQYDVMRGPWTREATALIQSEENELLWVTGGELDVVDAGNSSSVSDQFLCHSFLEFANATHGSGKENHMFGNQTLLDNSPILPFAQGNRILQFPDGFGVPVLSSEPLSFSTMVMNPHDEAPLDLQFIATFNYVREKELTQQLRPLFIRTTIVEGPSSDQFPKNWGAWIVEPGRHVNRTRITDQIGLPFDTTVHYIVTHVHAFAESLELRDVTTDTILFQSKTTHQPGLVGLADVQTFSSEAGIELFVDHEYELVSIYDNPTQEGILAMAKMRLYLLDHSFTNPVVSSAQPAP